MRKSSILAFQNPPKIHPKCLQNRRQKKHAFFHRFLLEFGCMLQKPTSKKRAPTQCFVSFSQISIYCFWYAFSLQKTYKNPFQNQDQTLQKSMPKTCCFSTPIFSGFGLDFGASWTSNLEPSWLKIAKNHYRVFFLALSNSMSFQNGVLDAAGLGFRASRS